MLTRFKKKHESIFLDPLSKSFHTQERVNVILSPSLYWVKRLPLPIKHARDAKKLLPSLFEDTLPLGDYSYSAYKSGDEFFIFAYEDKRILETLSQKGLLNVAEVYFAQTELSHIQKAVQINSTQSICVKEGILLLLPSLWVQEKDTLDLSQMQLSKHSLTLQQFGHILSSKSLFLLAALMLAFALLIATEYFITTHKISQIEEQKEELFAKYNLKTTLLENRSMLNKYETLHSKQMQLRESISDMLALKLKPSEELTQLSFKNNLLEAEFAGVVEGQEQHITQTLKNKKVDFKAFFKDKSLYIEVAI